MMGLVVPWGASRPIRWTNIDIAPHAWFKQTFQLPFCYLGLLLAYVRSVMRTVLSRGIQLHPMLFSKHYFAELSLAALLRGKPRAYSRLSNIGPPMGPKILSLDA
ncbi:hypothetical protein CL614_05105 [archaeon]|nr:hypothetical protein [archaeon]